MRYVARIGWPAEPEYEPGVPYLLSPSGPAYATEAETIAAITAESTKAYNDVGGRPLPLAAHWCPLSPKLSYQNDLIAAGYPVLPTVSFHRTTATSAFLVQADDLAYIETHGLPLTLMHSQPEAEFASAYVSLSDENTGETVYSEPFSIATATAVGTTALEFTTSGADAWGWNTRTGANAMLADRRYKILSAGTTNFTLYGAANNDVGTVFVASGAGVGTGVVARGVQTGSRVWFTGMTGGFSALNGTQHVVTVTASDTFTIAVNGSGYAAYSGGGTGTWRSTEISPFSADSSWSTLGNAWATCDVIEYLQEELTAPPKVFFLSNNEASYVTSTRGGTTADYDVRYQAYRDTNSLPDTETQKRYDTHFAMIARWDAYHAAHSAGLTSEAWQAASAPIAYFAGISPRFRSNWGWMDYNNQAVVSDDWDRIAWEPYTWTGASPEIYDNYSQWSTPYGNANWPSGCKATFLIWSPQNEAMALAVGRDIAYEVNPDYWFEISAWSSELWEGADSFVAANTVNSNKATTYATLGIDVSPSAYVGWLQYCMWVLTPRAVREFAYYNASLHSDLYETYFEAVAEMVGWVHGHPTLRRFWRDGTPVLNPTKIRVNDTHPFNLLSGGGGEFDGSPWETEGENGGPYPKNYHLTTNLDPALSGTINVGIASNNKFWPVWTLAYVIGTSPNREWLVYAHASGINADGTGRASAPFTDVEVTIPDYQTITLPTVPISGAFYYVVE